MRIVFCENNERDLSMLESYVKEFFEGLEDYEAEYASYRSGGELLVREDFVDFAFLDVEMPGLNGIQVGNQLKERNSAIKIFIITAYSDYLDEAMKFQVFRFLSKPLDKDRLHRNLKNSCDTAPQANRHGIFISTKKTGKNHGLGISSIERTVEKYNGMSKMYYDADKKRFHCIINVPVS